ncbi:MAG TPA: GNAT family N-acetyltransferase [Planctomycetota bacterium]|nr:GNAT family N-acetyltransferase [Planctomycetota bacterium]
MADQRPVASDGVVFLRAPARRDEAEFTDLVRRSRKLHRPWMAAPDTRERFLRYLRGGREPNRCRLLVCRREDGAILGVINISEIVRGPLQSAFLGYWVGAPFAGRGYMARGLALVLRHAFRTLKLHRLEANLQPGNARSRRLARGAGFRKEGVSPRYLKINGRWRDHERWAITREEWGVRGRGAKGAARTPRPRTPRARSRARR